jgi:hypothetical protein
MDGRFVKEFAELFQLRFQSLSIRPGHVTDPREQGGYFIVSFHGVGLKRFDRGPTDIRTGAGNQTCIVKPGVQSAGDQCHELAIRFGA